MDFYSIYRKMIAYYIWDAKSPMILSQFFARMTPLAIINHSEHRVPISHIREAVNRLSKLNLLSIVCAKNVSESGKMAALNPNFVAVEPPDLIGTGRSVSEHKPKTVSGSAEAVAKAKNRTELLCGAGIVTRKDVSSAISLGSRGILVASGVIRAKNWDKIIGDFASQI